MRALWFLLALPLVLLMAGCGGGGGGGNSLTTGSVVGYVYAGDAGLLTVQATRQASQTPLVGANVSVRDFPALKTVSDQNGYFQIDNVPTGQRELYVSASGYTRITLTLDVHEGTNTADSATMQTPTTVKWTVLVYMAADNDLESQGLKDFNEMEQVAYPDNVKVLVQFDRSTQGWGTAIEQANENWTGTRRYLIQQDADPVVIHSQLLEDMGTTDSGNPNTLHDFISWGQQYAPAEHYLLVIWNHGSGWDPYNDRTANTARAIGIDDGAGTAIRDVDLPSALAARDPLDIVATDACLMGMLEVAYEIRGQADYLVAAEEETPVDGFNYATFLTKLTSAEGLAMTPAQVAAYLAKDSYDCWIQQVGFYLATSSAIKLSETPGVITALNGLSKRLMSIKSRYPNQLTNASNSAERFSPSYYYVFADLSNYALLLSQQIQDSELRTQAANVQTAVSKAVLASYAAAGHPQAHGISVYFPTATVYARSGASSSYPLLDLCKDTSWDEWLGAQP